MKKFLLLMVMGLVLLASNALATTVIIDTVGAEATDFFSVSDDPLVTGNFYIANPIVTSYNPISHIYRFDVSNAVNFGVGLNSSPIITTIANVVLELYGLKNYTTELFQYNYDRLDWDSLVSGSSYSKIISGGLYEIVVTGIYDGVLGSSYTLGLNVTKPAVPIPGAALLLGSALLGLVGFRRTRTV